MGVNPIMLRFGVNPTANNNISDATKAPFGVMEVEVKTDVITEATTVFEPTTMVDVTIMTTTDIPKTTTTILNRRNSPPNSQPYSPTILKISEKEKKQHEKQEKQVQKKQERQEKQVQKKQDRQEKQDQKKQDRQEKQDQKQQNKKDQNQLGKQQVPLNLTSMF